MVLWEIYSQCLSEDVNAHLWILVIYRGSNTNKCGCRFQTLGFGYVNICHILARGSCKEINYQDNNEDRI